MTEDTKSANAQTQNGAAETLADGRVPSSSMRSYALLIAGSLLLIAIVFLSVR